MKKFIYLWGPVILFASLVFILSSMSSLPVKIEPFPNFDKVEHMCEYGLFAILLFRALNGTLSRADFIWIASLTVMITLAYGMSDEFHQSFVPHRDADVKDLVADGFGAIAAMTSIFIKRKVFGR